MLHNCYIHNGSMNFNEIYLAQVFYHFISILVFQFLNFLFFNINIHKRKK